MGRTGTGIILADCERDELTRFVSTGKHPAKIVRRARILLALDPPDGRAAMTQAQIAEAYGVSRVTVANTKRAYLERGITGLLARKKRERPPVPAKADGVYEAHLIALSCSSPPEGYSRWTVRLLADKSVELGYIESISHMTVSRILKKTNSSLT